MKEELASMIATKKLIPWGGVFSHDTLRQQQGDMIKDSIEALTKLPTATLVVGNGRGKTSIGLAVGLTLLEWKDIDRVYIVSRTHRQLAHYFDDINIVNDKRSRMHLAPVTAVELASREFLCINDMAVETSAISRSRSESTIDFACQNMQRHSPDWTERWCQCGFDTDETIKIMPDALGDEPLIADTDHLKAYGSYKYVCPYHQARILAKTAQIVVGTYNYFFDPFLQKVMGLKIENSLLVTDEAHNLPGVIESSLKKEITSETFKTLLDAKRKLPIEVQVFIDRAYKFFEDVKSRTLTHTSRTIGYDEFGQLLAQCQIDKFAVDELQEQLKELIKQPHLVGAVSALIAVGSFFSIYTTFGREAFVCYCDIGGHGKNRWYSIGILSLDLAPVMKMLLDQKAKFLFMTGTLDTDLFYSPLGLEENITTKALTYKEPKRNLQVYLYENGVDGHVMNSMFENRQNRAMIIDYGHTIQRVIRHVPNGSIILFPSYKIKDGVEGESFAFLEEEKSGDGWLKIWESAGIIVRSHGKDMFKAYDPALPEGRREELITMFNDPGDDTSTTVITDYKKTAEQSKTVLMACFRSRASEGEDYPDAQCRAVFIIGFPLANNTQASVKWKIDFYNKKKKGFGNLWHRLDAVNCVNQGCGRVIRDPVSDYGSVHLMDSRYINDLNIYSRVSDWIRDCIMPNVKRHVPAYVNPQLDQFYQSCRAKYGK